MPSKGHRKWQVQNNHFRVESMDHDGYGAGVEECQHPARQFARCCVHKPTIEHQEAEQRQRQQGNPVVAHELGGLGRRRELGVGAAKLYRAEDELQQGVADVD
eukprot:CAMPEP_0181216772 /NCGR_PEP_ID=MMETSP1096-20121128/26776_1 /TAXON_ID=156174 ORGANISM="Chrysochromulina ericina, Strain CCMP281" /NCGR_SAMPLE_ID=MMETSP1096 /ASSEMBLY_ACC=CAM_ASM_000453 /LENGTH=102 /DNA_ID=CAMNT_0023308819 /DNA_START=190 /DNA_END=498 /DNA_ORIENTATION=+